MDYIIETCGRKIKCHSCQTEIPKGVKKVRADLGRTTYGGYVWYYQLCLPCALKRIKKDQKEIKAQEYKIMEAMEEERIRIKRERRKSLI